MNKKIILSLDGGGIKGVSLVMILMKIMQELELQTGVYYEPCQIFNVFAGTSTGGLLSTFIGLKRHELHKALYLYMASDPDFFRPKNTFNIVKDVAKYDSNVAKNLYLKFYGSDHINKYQASDVVPYIISTALRIDKIPTQTYIFKNFKNNSSVSSITDFYIYEMARSTSAAPTFWSAYTPEISTIYKSFMSKTTTNTKTMSNMIPYTNNGSELTDLFEKYSNKYPVIKKLETDLNKFHTATNINKFRAECADAIVLVDGGLGSNNPVLLAVGEMAKLDGISNISLVVSIGCGNILTTDSEHYSKYREIYNDNQLSNLCIDLLDIITDALYIAYRKIFNYTRILSKEITTKSNMAQLEEYLELENLDFDIKDLTKSNIEFISKKDFVKQVITELVSIPINLIHNLGVYLINIFFKIPGFSKFSSVSTKKSSLVSGIIQLYRIVSYNIKTFIYVCGLCTNTIYEAYKSTKIQSTKSKTIYLTIDKISSKLEKIIVNPSLKSYLDFKIINILVENGANTILNVKNELVNFLEENVLEPLTSGAYESDICKNIFQDNYVRLDPVYGYRVNLAESNPINLRKMMRFTSDYITKSSNTIKTLAAKIKNIIDKPVNNVVKFDGFDTTKEYGYNIDNNINFMKKSIFEALDVTVYDIPTYISKKILSVTIEIFYRMYYEAYYCYINALINYNTNDILNDSPTHTFKLKYLHNQQIIEKSYSFDQLNNILNGNIDISEYYDALTTQTGAYSDILIDSLDREDLWYKTMNRINNILKVYKNAIETDDTHIHILERIIHFTTKIDNNNKLCYGCFNDRNISKCKSIDTNSKVLDDKITPSNNETVWNSCKSLYKMVDESNNFKIVGDNNTYVNLINNTTKSNKVLDTYYSSKYNLIKTNVRLKLSTDNRDIYMAIVSADTIDSRVKFRINDTTLSKTILDLLEFKINKNNLIIPYNLTKTIYTYKLLVPSSKKISISMYFDTDKYYILPLATLDIPLYNKNISKIQSLNSPNTNYASMLKASSYMDVQIYNVYSFSDTVDIFFDKINHKETDYKYKHTYNTSNIYYYDIDTSNKFIICIKIESSKLQPFEINENIIIIAKIYYVGTTNVHILPASITLSDNYYYVFYDQTQNIVANSVAYIELYYNDLDDYLPIYNSMNNGLLFNFN